MPRLLIIVIFSIAAGAGSGVYYNDPEIPMCCPHPAWWSELAGAVACYAFCSIMMVLADVVRQRNSAFDTLFAWCSEMCAWSQDE